MILVAMIKIFLKVIDNLNMVVAGVGLGIRSPNASKIIDKQNVLKQALKDMDKITGYDSARTLAQEDELYANLVNIWDVMKKTGMATDGTREAFETILSAKEGIDALYKSSAHNIDHNVKTIKDAVTRNIKQQKTGVLGKSK